MLNKTFIMKKYKQNQTNKKKKKNLESFPKTRNQNYNKKRGKNKPKMGLSHTGAPIYLLIHIIISK